MIHLSPEQYAAVRPLFTPLQQNLVVESVLDGHTQGRVYADEAANPQLAMLWTLMDTVLLAGQPDERRFPALRRLLLDEMLPDARARYIPHFTLLIDRPEWAAQFPALLPDQPLVDVPRLDFHLAGRRVDWQNLLPEGMHLHPLDSAFLARTNLANIMNVVGWVRSFWPDVAAFEQRELGFAVVAGQTVASWALAVYAGARALELGVETAVSHRGQGLATIAADACLAACAARGITPHWQCDEANAASVRLAARLGFVPQRQYRAYRLPFAF
ncbi:MAG: GNAT family N-acetyltransferase [Ardenticatenaceae bacterium]|nr:GNAT family N-acetyltransferase [Ardenticatenaceae bacterium]